MTNVDHLQEGLGYVRIAVQKDQEGNFKEAIEWYERSLQTLERASIGKSHKILLFIAFFYFYATLSSRKRSCYEEGNSIQNRRIQI
jgi:hypothetical protein